MNPRTRNRAKATGRREGGGFMLIPHAVLDCPNYIDMSWPAKALVADLARQYNGHSNNGDLTAAWRIMAKRGWRSKDTLHRALRELQDNGLIQLTRQGGRNACNLYAVTWAAIDECKGKLDYGPTNTPSGLWRQPAKQKELPAHRGTRVRQSGHCRTEAAAR